MAKCRKTFRAAGKRTFRAFLTAPRARCKEARIMKKEFSEHEAQLRLRKMQSDLASMGLGVIAFGVWSVIKTVLYVALDTEKYLGSFEGNMAMIVTFWVLLGGALAIDLALRLHVGRSAIAEGKGAKRRRGYIVLALLMAAASFAALAAGLFLQGNVGDVENSLVTLIVELTSDVLLLGVGVSAIRVKRLNRELTGTER